MTPHCTRRKNKKTKFVKAPYQTAIECLGTIEPGCRIFGFTKGQFSLIDLIQAILSQVGASNVTLSTWTTGIRDAENAKFMLDKNQIKSLKILTDRSFPSRQPKYAQALVQLFGEGAISCTRTHAKFAVIQNENFNIVIRSSMNLNKNPRFEQFDIDDDKELAEFLLEHVKEIEEKMPQAFDFKTNKCDEVFSNSLGGGLSKAYDLNDEEGTKFEMPSFDLDEFMSKL